MKSLRLPIVWTIIKKELKEMFDSPQAYIVLAVFLLLWEYLFFPVFIQIREASLTALFTALPWLFIIFIPAVTMRSVSQEKDQGTLELVLTHPVTELELLWGKFGAALLFTAIAMALTLPIVIVGAFFGRFDWGAVVSAYIGTLYMAAILISLGLFVSAAFKNALTSLIVSVVATFFLVVMGLDFVTQRLPLLLQGPVAQLSVLSHFAAFSRGVIDLRDVLYGALAITVFMGLAYLQLRRMKLGTRAKMYKSLRLGIALIIAIAVAVSIIGFRIPGRLDLTEGHLYTLAAGTRNILKDLKDVVRVTLYASANLPAQLQPGLRDIQNLLHDYEISGHGDLIIQTKNPDQDRGAADEAGRFGVQPIQFNIIGQGEFQAKSGYLGLVVQYADKNSAIPLSLSQAGIDTSVLEYQLTSALNELTTASKPTVAFLTGHGERGLDTDLSALKAELAKQFTIQTLTIDDKNPAVPDGVKAVVIAGPTQPIDDKTKRALNDYLSKGGSALVLIDRLNASTQVPTATENKNSFAEFLEPYHVSVEKNIAYDLRSNENVAVGNGQFNLILPYPFWVKALRLNNGTAAAANVASVVLPWTSSISIDTANLAADKETADPLYATTPYAGLETPSGSNGAISINPNQQFPANQSDLRQQVLAAAITKSTPAMHLIVVGNSRFLTDNFTRQMPENLNFGLSALEWLAQGSDLASIRSRNTAARPLQFASPTEVSAFQYANYAFVILFPLAAAVVRLSRRRAMMGRKYEV